LLPTLGPTPRHQGVFSMPALVRRRFHWSCVNMLTNEAMATSPTADRFRVLGFLRGTWRIIAANLCAATISPGLDFRPFQPLNAVNLVPVAKLQEVGGFSTIGLAPMPIESQWGNSAMTDNAKQELQALAKDWARAFVINDAEAIGQYMADDWAVVTPNGN